MLKDVRYVVCVLQLALKIKGNSRLSNLHPLSVLDRTTGRLLSHLNPATCPWSLERELTWNLKWQRIIAKT